MSHNALLEYIRKAKDCGAEDAQIVSRLNAAGWYRVDIQDALDLYKKLSERPQNVCGPQPDAPKPSVAERIVPDHYNPLMVVVAAISFAIGFIVFTVIR